MHDVGANTEMNNLGQDLGHHTQAISNVEISEKSATFFMWSQERKYIS